MRRSPGSGRHRKSIEEKRVVIIEKAWDIVGEFLNDPQTDRNYRLQYAIDIVKRSIPQQPIIDQSKHQHFTKIEVNVSDDTKIPLTQNARNGLPVG